MTFSIRILFSSFCFCVKMSVWEQINPGRKCVYVQYLTPQGSRPSQPINWEGSFKMPFPRRTMTPERSSESCRKELHFRAENCAPHGRWTDLCLKLCSPLFFENHTIHEETFYKIMFCSIWRFLLKKILMKNRENMIYLYWNMNFLSLKYKYKVCASVSSILKVSYIEWSILHVKINI